MPTLPQFLSQAFNGIALGSLLALIACGLTIILGTLGVLNFAHGAMFMLGAYVAFIVLGHLDSFAAALVLGALALLAFGFVLERGLIRLYYDRPHEDQILVTFGLAIMMIEAVHYVFGGESQRVPVPSWGRGIVNLHFFYYPLYRVEAIGIAGLILLGFYLGKSGAGSVYGAAGSLVLIVLWLYYSSIILLLGAEFTRVWVEAHGREIEPKEGSIRTDLAA